MNFPRIVYVCNCSHLKRSHFCTKAVPAGPCTECPTCPGFTPEPVCKCGHGKKAHDKHKSGHCHECGCKKFRAA